ncbi:isochorismatase family cysteine hydrolase [Uniformispora flossi]|uniref:isochorismatase family cysteine hydrolase n=1 Tax=Uniformispora flossi TaxID=3390723 RepID=UPI003C2CF7D4
MDKTAVLVIDMINTYEHKDAERLVSSVRETLPAMRRLIRRARDAGTDVIYVNDNFGRWRSDHREFLAACLDGPHGDLVRPIAPDPESMFVVKARHSAFFQTPLEYLLDRRGVQRVVLCGQATEQCVLYSAIDAHVRHFRIVVPRDAVAHIHPDLADAALRMIELNLDARVCPEDQVAFA